MNELSLEMSQSAVLFIRSLLLINTRNHVLTRVKTKDPILFTHFIYDIKSESYPKTARFT